MSPFSEARYMVERWKASVAAATTDPLRQMAWDDVERQVTDLLIELEEARDEGEW